VIQRHGGVQYATRQQSVQQRVDMESMNYNDLAWGAKGSAFAKIRLGDYNNLELDMLGLGAIKALIP